MAPLTSTSLHRTVQSSSAGRKCSPGSLATHVLCIAAGALPRRS